MTGAASHFAGLVQTALLGTERQAHELNFTEPSSANRLLVQLQGKPREETLLAAAAVLGVWERAGRLPQKMESPLPLPASSETRAWVNDRTTTLFFQITDLNQPELIRQWLSLTAQENLIARPELLPTLLALGAAQSAWRDEIRPVLGARGEWLSTHNADWNWLQPADHSTDSWETGEGKVRLQLLHALRKSDPGKARGLLASTWKEESPEDRAAFLEELTVGLTESDEAFLESTLDDKRKEVRKTATKLLSRIPSSQLLQRLFQSAMPCLRWSSPGMKKTAAIELTLPEQCTKSMQRDGIELKTSLKIGEKSWWLIQMLERIPLKTWETAWAANPEMILEASSKSEWSNELLEAWHRAALWQKNADWIRHLADMALDQERLDRLQELLPLLDASDFEPRLSALLKIKRRDDSIGTIGAAILLRSPFSWSEAFSETVLQWMLNLTTSQIQNWQLRSQFKPLALRVHPASLSRCSTVWNNHLGLETDSFWRKGADEFLEIIYIRQQIYTAFGRLSVNDPGNQPSSV